MNYRRLYAGLDPNKEVVVYCQSGVRASLTAAVLRDLGFKDVKVYEPSWLGYAGVERAGGAGGFSMWEHLTGA
ncbi:MAG: rhodanese-like domain-containing protein [Nitrospira sp.]